MGKRTGVKVHVLIWAKFASRRGYQLNGSKSNPFNGYALYLSSTTLKTVLGPFSPGQSPTPCNNLYTDVTGSNGQTVRLPSISVQRKQTHTSHEEHITVTQEGSIIERLSKDVSGLVECLDML